MAGLGLSALAAAAAKQGSIPTGPPPGPGPGGSTSKHLVSPKPRPMPPPPLSGQASRPPRPRPPTPGRPHASPRAGAASTPARRRAGRGGVAAGLTGLGVGDDPHVAGPHRESWRSPSSRGKGSSRTPWNSEVLALELSSGVPGGLRLALRHAAARPRNPTGLARAPAAPRPSLPRSRRAPALHRRDVTALLHPGVTSRRHRKPAASQPARRATAPCRGVTTPA